MKNMDEQIKNILEKRTISKDEFTDQVMNILELSSSTYLSPEAFELAVKWTYKKYKLGLVEIRRNSGKKNEKN